MSIDAMQQALKALESINDMSKPPMCVALPDEIDGAMDALRKAIREAALDGLAQTSQEIEWDTSDMAYRPNGLSVEQAEKQEKLCKYCGGIGRVVCDGRCMPEQEPVAWMVRDSIDGSWYPCAFENPAGAIKGESKPLYTALPKREWVSLTDDEVHEAAIKCVKSGQSVDAAIRAIEAKLKERNNG